MARDHNQGHGDFLSGVGEMVYLLERLRDVPVEALQHSISRIAHEVGEKARDLAPEEPEPRDKRKGFIPIRESLRIYMHRRKKFHVIRFATRHAAAQHERMDYQHQTGQAKFLEIPFRAARSEFYSRLASDTEDQIRKTWLQKRAARQSRRAAREAGQ